MQTPARWPALALIAGSACGTFLDVNVLASTGILLLAWLVAVVAWWQERPLVLVAALTIGFSAGAAAAAAHVASRLHDPAILRHLSDEPTILEGRLREDAALTVFGATVTLDVERVQVGSRRVDTSGGVRLSIGGALTNDRRPAWRAGRRLRVTATLKRPLPYRNFGLPDDEHRQALRGVRLVGSVKSAALVEVIEPGTAWREACAAVRAWSRRAIGLAVGRSDPEAAAIVTAVLIGDRAGLSPDLERRLQRAGTFHVIAISGGNVAVLVGIVLWIVARTGLSPRVRASVAMTALGAYAATVMGGASVERATLAAALYLAARAFDLRTSARSVMTATVAVLLALDPVLVADTGFWLTFLASVAIVEQALWASGWLERGWLTLGGWPLHRVARAAVTLAAATLVAEGALVPVSTYAFSQVTSAGLLLNFAAIPLMGLVQVAGLATLAAAAVHPDLAALPGAVAGVGARAIVESARLVDFAPWAVLRVPAPPLWLVVAAVVSWASAWLAGSRTLRAVAGTVWGTSLLTIVVGPVLPAVGADLLRHPVCHPPEEHADVVRMTVLDVAQGAAILLRLPDRRAVLVDAGGAPYASRFDLGARIVSPALWALGVRRLSTLVLTHGDGDHVGGAMAVLRDFDPIEIWEGVPVPGVAAMDALGAAADSAGVRWTRVQRGVSRAWGAVTLHVWHPEAPDWERRRVRNDDSIVIELRVGHVSIVLPGDIGAGVERELAALMPPSRLRVLLAAHHGSRTSTSQSWLQAIDPGIVIVSAGRDNPHGHPARAMLDRVATHGASLYRTDIHGAIEVDTDGTVVRVATCSGRVSR